MKDEWDKKLKIYDDLVAQCSDFERKGKTMPYTSANGYMFSLLNKEAELGIRLSKDSGEAFKEKHQTTIFKSHGATMRGYVLIPDALLSNEELMVSLFNEGYQYVMSLEPK